MKELIELLRGGCNKCPNFLACEVNWVVRNDCQLRIKAADAIEKLEAENAQLRRERDAMLADFKELARYFVYVDCSFSMCNYCAKYSTCKADCDFEWRGAQNHIAGPGKGVQEEI